MKTPQYALLLVLVFPQFSFTAQKVEVRSIFSDSSTSSTVNYHYSGSDNSIWSSDVMYVGNRSKIKDSSGETQITRELQWVNAWDLSYNWFVELGVGGSNTKVNKIRTGNADVTLGRTSDSFYSFNWSLTAGKNSIKQTEGRTSSSTELALQQTKTGLQLGIEPFDWLSISIFQLHYKYDKDVDEQLALLENEASIQRYGTAFSDQLSSLIETEAGISLGFKMGDDWKLSLNFVQTQDAPEPKVKGTSMSSRLFHKFNSEWDGSILVGSNKYESTATTPKAEYGYIGFGAGFSW